MKTISTILYAGGAIALLCAVAREWNMQGCDVTGIAIGIGIYSLAMLFIYGFVSHILNED